MCVNARLIVIGTFVLAAHLGLAQGLPSTSKRVAEREGISRKLRFGYRELNLPSALQNDELRLQNHELDNEIAVREGRDIDMTAVTIDLFFIEQDKAAIQTAAWFSQVWAGDGDMELQHTLSPSEAKFDDAFKTCHATRGKTTDTLAQTQIDCASLHDIYVTVSHYQITVSNPAPSVFVHGATLNSTGEKLFRTDSLQLKVDMQARRPEQIKTRLVRGDRELMNLDKTIWLTEIGQADIAKYNAEYPDYKMRDLSDVLPLVMDARKEIAAVHAKFRQQISGTHR